MQPEMEMPFMAIGLLRLFSKDRPAVPLLDYINHLSFDELISVDLSQDRYKFIFNVEEKYQVQTNEGVYSLFYDYIVKEIIHPDDRRAYAEMMDPATVAQRLKTAEVPGALALQYRFRDTNGGWRWIEQYVGGGAAHGLPEDTFYCYIFDIQNRKDREGGKTNVSYRDAARCDVLTGLPLEKDFCGACEGKLADTGTDRLLVVIDLQHFKLFNEWYGRDAGDRVLADIRRTLGAAAEAHDGVAGYMGGDDFSLLVPAEGFDLDDLFEHIHAILGNHGASVGFFPAIGAVRSQGSASIYHLYDQASLACQEAKKDFRNRIMFFDPSMLSKAAEDYKILSDFRDALYNGEITFHLQPQCRSLNGHIVGAEALARWITPDGRRIPPVAFIPVLEKYGFIPDLDKFIWEAVCRWIRKSLDDGNPLIPVSVNISPVDIFAMDVPAYFESLVEKYGLPKGAIKVEITESAYGEGSEKIRNTVQDFRDRGFRVLMDDFGSGFSSLNMLRELNVDMIKLDAYFLRMDQVTERKGMHILESVVNMAKTMDVPIIVEGVETEEQNEYLMSLGCRYIQGYFFFKPMPAEAFEALIADREAVDDQGFVNKANDEFRIREFLNDTVYTDSMLNNIIGPALLRRRPQRHRDGKPPRAHGAAGALYLQDGAVHGAPGRQGRLRGRRPRHGKGHGPDERAVGIRAGRPHVLQAADPQARGRAVGHRAPVRRGEKEPERGIPNAVRRGRAEPRRGRGLRGRPRQRRQVHTVHAEGAVARLRRMSVTWKGWRPCLSTSFTIPNRTWSA